MSTVDDSSLECVVHLSASSVQFHAKPDLNRSGFRVFRALDTVPINMGEAAPKTPYRGTDEFRAKEREKYWNLTPEQRARKQAYNREWRRRKRAQQKAKKAAAGSPTSPLQPVSETTAPMKPAKPTTQPQAKPAQPMRSQDLASYEELSTHKAKTLQKVWRAEVSEYLLDAITRPDSPFSGAGLRASKMLAFWFNISEKLDRIVEADSDKPASQQEMTLAVMIECLRRLTGEGKTSAAPALPGIAHKLP
jgi:hypothetical protein